MSAPDNPLLTQSSLPYQLPPFSRIKPEHFLPAFQIGAAEQLAQLAEIVSNTDPATFENVLIPLETAGTTLTRTVQVFYNLISSMATPVLQWVEGQLSPRLTAHQDEIYLNRALFERLSTVYATRNDAGLRAEQIRLVERYYSDFSRAGASLGADDAEILKAYNQQLAVLSTRFHQNLQAATEAAAVIVDDPAQCDGLSADDIAAAAAAADERGHHGKYLLTLILPTGQPILPRLNNRELRRRVHEASTSRASSGEHNNGPIAIEMAVLRAKRAALLGFSTHADYVAADGTASTSAKVDALLSQLVPPAVGNARAEAAILAELAAADGVEIAAWDWLYYSEKVRAVRFELDTEALRPYFELNAVLQKGVFFAAQALYGISFEPREDLAGYHDDVRVFEVKNESGEPLGLFLGDFFARETKRGGAWMNSLVDQSAITGLAPVIVNNLNITKPATGEPALLTIAEVKTLFHEFGHALHGLFSDVGYPRLSGTSVPRDFVEFPSQVNEMWQFWPEVLQNYARHVVTGEALDHAVIDRIRAAELWGEGFATAEYLGATLLDQAWHRITTDTVIENAQQFEAEALENAGLAMDMVPPRYRTTYFQHIFSGGYAAGYYAYIWAEILDAETVEWFKAHGGMTRANGDKFRSELLSVGGSRDPMAAVRSLLGREPEILPLLRRRGLMAKQPLTSP
ncbi:M3 family peptidase [Nakamurella antarctica]|uniref:M3 family peptidase n=1 Tax=Nakamurella antarctica TaxID=1902245 RepID=A0A3G8ZQI6_9ACTN|nr:M3 family metallopeptidase [Nakamurella antarctica]AZI59067.1 M3 family peptidase [Nakamurella antarctica]